MKNKILLLLIICIFLTGCTRKLSEDKIKKQLEVNTEERTYKINKIKYATKKITIKDISFNVEGTEVYLGDFYTQSAGDKYIQITGYYDQSASQHHVYILSENKNKQTTVWELVKEDDQSFNVISWVNKSIVGATNLVLIDCKETTKEVGQTPLRYQVYAQVDDKLVLVG